MNATKKALIVGIDYYEHLRSLHGAVNDAHDVKSVLERNADGTLNFSTPKLLTGTGPNALVTRAHLRQYVEELFADDVDIALFYFSGHGYIDDTGGFLCASDCRSGHDGLALHDIMSMANNSKAKNKIIILDSCHGGVVGNSTTAVQTAEISDGVTILTASTADQYALETGGSGVFTSLLVDALSGAAANLVGSVTPGSVYAHIDQSLGVWAQRPVFKTNVKKFVSLRETEAPIVSFWDTTPHFNVYDSSGNPAVVGMDIEVDEDAPSGFRNTPKWLPSGTADGLGDRVTTVPFTSYSCVDASTVYSASPAAYEET